MPKIKSKTAVLKRFKITKTGKVICGRQMGRHLKAAKTKSNIRRHKEPAILTGAFAKKIRQLAHGQTT